MNDAATNQDLTHSIPSRLGQLWRCPAALLALTVLTLAVGCSQTDDSGTGNTNWKLECETTEDCEGAYLCQCGYCTPRCDGKLDCSRDPEKICVDPESSEDAGSGDAAAMGDDPQEPMSDDEAADESASGDAAADDATSAQSDDGSPSTGTDSMLSDAATDQESDDEASSVTDAQVPGDDALVAEDTVDDDVSVDDAATADAASDEPSADATAEDAGANVAADSVIDCVSAIGSTTVERSEPSSPMRFIGSNGEFTEHCRSDGNLTSYVCEMYSPDPFSGIQSSVSGNVLEGVIDCDGRCEDGRCVTGCPRVGESITVKDFLETGEVLIGPDDSGRDYACFLARQEETIDCVGVSQRTGEVQGMTFPANIGPYCTGGPVGTLSVQFDEGYCVYEGCRIAWDDDLPDPPPPTQLGYGATESFSCEAGVPQVTNAYYGGDRTVRSEVTYDGGSAGDSCDADGNLVELSCETRIIGDCVDQPNAPLCPRETTGAILESEIDCSGRCSEGRCEIGCPFFYDRLLVESQTGDTAIVADLTLSKRYECNVGVARDGDETTCGNLEGEDAYIITRGVNEPCSSDLAGSWGICVASQPLCSSGHCTMTDCMQLFE